MKVTEFRKLIREEIREITGFNRALASNTREKIIGEYEGEILKLKVYITKYTDGQAKETGGLTLNYYINQTESGKHTHNLGYDKIPNETDAKKAFNEIKNAIKEFEDKLKYIEDNY